MEKEKLSTEENLSKRTVDQKNVTKTEHRSLVESKISAITATSEKEKNSPTKAMNSFRKETAMDNNGILKETSASEFYSERVSDTEEGDKSVPEKEDTFAKIIVVDQLDKKHSRQEKSSYDGSKREIENPKRSGVTAMIGGCQRSFLDIIGKREQRREELEKIEGDLRQRLDMLECSMPAVMVWNTWRMSRGAPVCKMKRILEKQFKDARELSCRSTPSRHYDCRVREVEAERKLASKKVEEARALWSEKLATLEERKRKLEEAKKIQEEQRNAMERLSEEAKALRETKAMEMMDESCRYGECGDRQCKQRQLDKVSSVMSIESGDIQCLEKLQRLAEEEVIMKRDITELERREEAYMRTLQQADELWSRMEGDAISATSALQEQLDMKTAANQQLADRVCELEDALEKCQARLVACRAELEKFLTIEKVEATIGRDDDVAKVTDKEVAVRAKVVHRPIGRADDIAMVKDDEVLARIEVVDGEALARVEVADEEVSARIATIDADAEAALIGDDKFVSVRPDLVDLAVDRPVDLVRIEDAESVVRPEDIAYEQQKFKEVREYLAKLGSLEELYKDDGEACAPEFVCNDVVVSPTGMTDEELIALGVEPAAPTKKPDEKLIVSEEERERQLRKELVEKPDGDIEVKEEEADEVSGVEVERKVVERAEERITEIADATIKETRRVIREEVANDRPVTMPNDVRTPEVKEIEADRGVMIQRDTFLSWIDTIDTIRTKAAEHPDCHAVKKDADVLAEQVASYIGIKPKQVKEKDIKIITAENKQEKVNEKNEIKTEQIVTIGTNLQDKLAISNDKEMEPVTKIEVPFPRLEETSAEVTPPIKSIAESELLPTHTKEEISVDMEAPMAVSIEDSFQPLTIPVKEDFKDDTVPLTEPYKVEKIKLGEETQVKEIVQDMKEVEISQVKKIEKNTTVADLINNAGAARMANDKTVDSINKEQTLVPKVKEEEEVIFKQVERDEKEVDISDKAIIEREKVVEKINTDEVSGEINAKVVEELKDAPLNKIKMIDVKETRPHEEINERKEIEEITEVPTVAEIKEIEQETEEAIMTVEEIKEITPEIVSPIADIKDAVADVVEEKIKIEKPPPISDTKEKKVEEIEPSEFPVVDIEEVSIADVIEEKIKVEETPLISKEEKIEKIEFPVIDTEKISIADVIEEKIKAEEPPILDMREEPLIQEAVIEEKIEIEKPTPEIDVTQEIVEITELPPITEVKEEKIEIEEPLPIADVITEEIVEMIQPVTEPPPTIKKEMEEIEELVPVVEIKKEKDEEIPEKVTPLVELAEERKEKEMLPIEKKEISVEIAVPAKPTLEDKKEEIEEKRPEVVEIELKIPIAEIKPVKTEIPAIDPRLVAQPYLIIAKIKEKELLQIIPAVKPSSIESYLRPPVETAEPVEIQRTDVVQTEIVQTEIAQNVVVQTEIVETEVVQITTQTIPTAEPSRAPPIRIIREYLKPTELKAPSAEIVGDRPEITGRKMLWRKRLQDQSTVTTASNGSQTDRTGHVSHDRVVRDERERARVPTDELLRSIKIAAGLARPDIEREIRTINYGVRSDGTGKLACNCCQCGRIPTPPSIRPRLEVQPQIDAKTATPPAFTSLKRVFIPPKIDRPIPYDRLCPDCKATFQVKMSREKHHIEKIIKKISRDQGSCGCASLTGKSCRTVPRKRAIEKRDQACLAKIPKEKINLDEQKKKENLQSILEESEKLDVKPLSSSCICFKLERTGVQPIRKGNCYCAD